ncbi:pyrimidine utilization regulatory protein R [Roseateles aquatilis]|uniref:Pyrimidine utilization regulatory protein R n=1 Tax=Roseateles aquatilis TaxID=431061 RepID=A0A246JE10_9BURK|nr:HTH-type transcriptional regulator RutR [Roseateles aquatilis]OWQ90737.1 pyrimidine utilization regulatory protein R [Roseateles aquatilis]
MEKDAEHKPVRKTARVAAKALPDTVARRQRLIGEKRQVILDAALRLFSQAGLHGVSVEEIAKLADVSKTNLLYYFANKDDLYVAVLRDILAVWLEPLRSFSAEQDPRVAISGYIRQKMQASRDNPEASRLFCLELVRGAPLLGPDIKKGLKALVAQKTEVILQWRAAGQFSADVDPAHFLFALWSTTQQYADFAFQVQALTGKTLKDRQFFEQSVANVERIILDGVLARTGDQRPG